MTALAADRNTPAALGDLRRGDAAASVLIYAGALVMRDASGNITKGATATGAIGVGRAEERVDNTGGAAAAKTVPYRAGIFRFANSGSTDAITKADIGKACWIVDDQTVARTSGTNTRSRAGIVEMVDDQGVHVRFDEALTRVATATAS
ncbi:hypothetical protein SAMN05421763_103279 [[Luteovulum] sphaeroides subsp. megalophilum]|uniref:hypothetical protein n=1 Tax=Cereibacter sphaeroides TaxID=1063 RepID=UPI000B7140F5|nr:hypothetical protein [Cereibacter sphaeroides]SNS86821.1 hypothetical protein SAMN05421763_103279 [[Luteovulum] sphaeroides subsp. megalophilum]